MNPHIHKRTGRRMSGHGLTFGPIHAASQLDVEQQAATHGQNGGDAVSQFRQHILAK
ncbi:MAG TPA: hypothetical protein P5186_10995 [Candidatus Paceibacterota bacterium]|nr:hypothetical protein [Candidatus Paceibacterota bacterium]